MDIPFRKSKNGVLINIRVQPRSSKRSIESVEGDVVRVKLTAPPADGAANAQLIEVLSKELQIRKSAISIVKGQASRDKVVEVRATPEELSSLNTKGS